MNQTIRVNEFPPTLNELNNIHYRVRAKKKEYWSKLIEKECIAQQIKPMNKVSVTFEFYLPDKRRRDLDNLGFAAKFVLDGLVNAGILVDDSYREVSELRFVIGGITKPKRMNIHLVEVRE